MILKNEALHVHSNIWARLKVCVFVSSQCQSYALVGTKRSQSLWIRVRLAQSIIVENLVHFTYTCLCSTPPVVEPHLHIPVLLIVVSGVSGVFVIVLILVLIHECCYRLGHKSEVSLVTILLKVSRLHFNKLLLKEM